MGPEAHGDQEGRLEGAASDSNRSARSERMQGTTCTGKVEARAWSRDTSGQRTRRAGYQGGPHGPRRREAPPPPRSGGWEVVSTCVPGGWWSAAGVTAARREMHGQDRVLFLCEKKAPRPCVAPYLWASVYNCTRANTNTNTSCVGVVRVRLYPNSAGQPGRPRKGRE